MIIGNELIDELFRAFHIPRWNDRARTMDFIEMDKHAQKMIIAYCLGRYEENAGNTIDWHGLIRNGLFELLRRIVISDIKSPIFREIRKNKEVFAKLNNYVYNQLKDKILIPELREQLQSYLLEDTNDSLTRRVLDASHIYTSLWEFRIIRRCDPDYYQNPGIERKLAEEVNSYSDLIGIKKILSGNKINHFIDLCSQLRFQVRWAQTPRVPRTTVLGHSILVACLSYLFTLSINHCDKRIYDNYFGGLFHDLPEAVTRDIISPVKRSSVELDNLIVSLERNLAEEELFPLLEDFMVDEIKYFIQDEFSNKAIIDNNILKDNITFEVMNTKYNSNEFHPFDGKIIRAADHLSTFLEAWHSCKHGIHSEELVAASNKIREQYEFVNFYPISMKEIYDHYEILS